MCCGTWTPSWSASVGLTPANLPEAEVAGQIQADLDAQGVRLGELHIDRAYLASAWSATATPTWRSTARHSRSATAGGRFAKPAFTIDFDQATLTCPNSIQMPFTPGGKVQFPAQVCQACPLRARVHHQHPRPQRADPPR